MAKLRIKIEITVEYEPNPEHYAEADRTPEGMLAIDLAGAEADPFSTIDNRNAVWKITGEVVQEKSND